MSGLRFESMADMPPRMRELYARQQIDLSGAGRKGGQEGWLKTVCALPSEENSERR